MNFVRDGRRIERCLLKFKAGDAYSGSGRGGVTMRGARSFHSCVPVELRRIYLLEWITHGAPTDVIDSYTTLPWETLCEQVLKLDWIQENWWGLLDSNQ